MKMQINIQGGKVVVWALLNIPKATDPFLFRAVNAYVILLQSHIAEKKLSGQILKVDSGMLRSGLRPVLAQRKGPMISAGITTNVRYWRIHELGGIIRPKRAKALTIPFPGVKGRARDFDDTFIAKGVIFQKSESGPIPLFSLKKEVRIPRRPYLQPSLRETEDRFFQLVDGAIDKGLAQA